MMKKIGGSNRCYYVACNVYISAGSKLYSQALLKILKDTQKYCLKQQQEQKQRVVVVHAFADQPYNRSSIHLAGTPKGISNVASYLTTNAIQTLNDIYKSKKVIANNTDTTTTISTKTDHPTVGLVDHVSVLPLTTTNPSHDFNNHHDDDDDSSKHQISTKEQWYECFDDDNPSASSSTTTTPTTNTNTNTNTKISTPDTPTLPTGWVAREIGIALQKIGVDVLLYGYAHEDTSTPLATIRRERTKFFKNSSKSKTSGHHYPFVGQATVGAPTHFVENYNIRLKSHVDKKLAMDLTKYLREKDGGLNYVEALTLPYSNARYETACNLLNPDVTSSNDIDMKIKEWIHKHKSQKETGACETDYDPIEIAYRVGTTASQCLDVLQQTSSTSPNYLEEYNSRILDRFRKYLQ